MDGSRNAVPTLPDAPTLSHFAQVPSVERLAFLEESGPPLVIATGQPIAHLQPTWVR
jgi:hypothetical protein